MKKPYSNLVHASTSKHMKKIDFSIIGVCKQGQQMDLKEPEGVGVVIRQEVLHQELVLLEPNHGQVGGLASSLMVLRRSEASSRGQE